MTYLLDSFRQSVATLERRSGAYNHEERRTYLQDTVRRAIGMNMVTSHRVDRYRYSRSGSTYEQRMQSRQARKQFAKEFAVAVRMSEPDLACRLLNHTPTIREGGTDWCEILNDVFSDISWHKCESCNHIDDEDNGRWAYDGDHWACQSCIDDEYYYSDRADTYVRCDDSDYDDDGYDEDEEESTVIMGRHSGKRILKHIPSSFDRRKPEVFLGMELEMECNDSSEPDDKAEELYSNIKHYADADNNYHQYIHIEEDGSLNNGFEMITGWTGLDVHAQMLKFFKKPWRGMRSHDTRTCGLHVHVSKANMTLFHACKLVFFIHDSGNQKLIRDIARRSNAGYAKICNKKASYDWIKEAKGANELKKQLMRLNDDRSEALNFQNPETVEFRLFKGTLRYETQMACLEFAYASWFFARDTGVGELTSAKFIEYICQPNQRKDTKFLRQYLREKGYSIPKLALVKPNPRNDDGDTQPIEKVA
jgi:hypothetical protein